VAVKTQGALWAADASALYVCPVEIESTLIHCVAGRPGDCTSLGTTYPFPAPHHTILEVELIGVGHIPMPGEVPLAHHGMLFLGELPGLRRQVLESLC
jgi:magnesium chelatase family protein